MLLNAYSGESGHVFRLKAASVPIQNGHQYEKAATPSEP
jgi:hypothetical protein